MKTEKALFIILTVANLIFAIIVTILIYWTMRMNELRMSQLVEQNRLMSNALHKGKLNNTGQIQVLGDLRIR